MSSHLAFTLLPTYILNSIVCIQSFTRLIYVCKLQGTLRRVQTFLFVDFKSFVLYSNWECDIAKANCRNCLLRTFSCHTIHFYASENISGSRNIKKNSKNWPDNSIAITVDVSHSCIDHAPPSNILSYTDHHWV